MSAGMPAPAQKLVYDHTVEGMFVRALGPRLSPACRGALLTAGLDLTRPLKKTYPAEDYERFIRICREHLFAKLSDDEAYRQMGALFVEGYFQTVIGGALKGLLRLLGPKRNLERLPANFGGGTNYVQAQLFRLDLTLYELEVTNVGRYPSFTLGSIETLMQLAGAKGLQVTPRQVGDDKVRYQIRWSA